jgi:hypothetical protein
LQGKGGRSVRQEALNDPARVAKVYSEEVGHFLDTQLKKSDTLGDEGELFRKLLAGEELSAADKIAIRADNDHGVINVNGKAIQVEYSIFDDIGKAVSGAAKAVGNAVSGAAKAVGNAPVVTSRNCPVDVSNRMISPWSAKAPGMFAVDLKAVREPVALMEGILSSPLMLLSSI